jgi:hypothetical protein
MYAPLPTYEVRAYVGTREQYDGPFFGKKRVLDAVREFQLGPGDNVALVRVTECDYVAGDYWEGGFELAVLDYPRFPKGQQWVKDYMLGLGKHLLQALNQNRVGVVTPEHFYLFENRGAAAEPSCVVRGRRVKDGSFGE